ncbi:MAG TPA: transglycosylase SLT domain-containing protein [Gammaproteobacteria bacterium]|jgi:hypothetical protein|nr:transglycosylase SLT domain-containing protein [Gammaproteobacteria bacterium]
MGSLRLGFKTLGAALALTPLLFAAMPARAGDGLTRQQNWAVLYASVVGSSYYADNVPQNYDFPRTLTAVLTQESSLCDHKKGMDKHSYGCGQVRQQTALLMSGNAVTAHSLQHNDSFNIRIAARYLAYCMQEMPDWNRSVICYNRGPYHARSMSDRDVAKDGYLKSIRHRMHEAQSLLARLD